MIVKRGKNPTYFSWRGMRSRCLQPKDGSYKNYGAKGIKICDEWDSYEKFVEDMGERPSGHTLDRIDSTKGYSKDNCRWATRRDQILNRKLISRNKTGYRGVVNESYQSKVRPFTAYIGTKEGGSIYLGRFVSAKEAALAYNRKAMELFGDKAVLNVVSDD